MLLQTSHILTVNGELIAADKPDWGTYMQSKLSNYMPIETYPPTPGGSDALIANTVHVILETRKPVLPSLAVVGPRIKSRYTFLPEGICNLLVDPKVSQEDLGKALTAHFKRLVEKQPAPPLTAEIEKEHGNVRSIWQEKLPPWLPLALGKHPVILAKAGRLGKDSHAGEAVHNNIAHIVRYTNRSLNPQEHIYTQFEEALHVAQDLSSYWQSHQQEIEKATHDLTKRILAKDHQTKKFTQEIGAKRTRQHLQRHNMDEEDIPYFKYDLITRPEELVVDMASIEAKLLSGQQTGKPCTQEKADRLMAKRFPEIYPHYKAFLNDCMEMATHTLKERIPEQEAIAQVAQWQKSPFAEYAKTAYAPGRPR
ncbi:MAG: hypothetical protein K2Q01_04955 [Rickettsiales bacterium]|nr:hypothetical protein [Rickettsiales bacterium]